MRMKREYNADVAPAKVGNYADIFPSTAPDWPKFACAPLHGKTEWFNTHADAVAHAKQLGLPVRRDDCKEAATAPAQAGRHSVVINGAKVNALKLLSDLSIERARSAALLKALREMLKCNHELDAISRPVADQARAAVALATKEDA
jgi:hypothetical protein